jgi:hypothetical protein
VGASTLRCCSGRAFWGREHRDLLVRDSMRRLVVGFGEPDRVEVVAPEEYLLR